MTDITAWLVLVIIAAVFYGIYLSRTIKDDGLHSRRQPPASHHRDSFDPRIRAA